MRSGSTVVLASLLASLGCGTRTSLEIAADTPACRWSMEPARTVFQSPSGDDVGFLGRTEVRADRVVARVDFTDAGRSFAVDFDGQPLGSAALEGPYDAAIGFGRAGATFTTYDPYPGSSFVLTDAHGRPGSDARPLGDFRCPYYDAITNDNFSCWLRATPEGFTYFDPRHGDDDVAALVRLDATGKEISQQSIGRPADAEFIGGRLDLDDGGFMLLTSGYDRGSDDAPWVVQRFAWDGRALAPPTTVLRRTDDEAGASFARFDRGAAFLTMPTEERLDAMERKITMSVVAVDELGEPIGRSGAVPSHTPIAARQLLTGELVILTVGSYDYARSGYPLEALVFSHRLSLVAEFSLELPLPGFQGLGVPMIVATPCGALVLYPPAESGAYAVAPLHCD